MEISCLIKDQNTSGFKLHAIYSYVFLSHQSLNLACRLAPGRSSVKAVSNVEWAPPTLVHDRTLYGHVGSVKFCTARWVLDWGCGLSYHPACGGVAATIVMDDCCAIVSVAF